MNTIVDEKIKFPLKNKLIILMMIAIVPLLCITIYFIIALINYSNAYDKIVSNMTIANSYNLDFKNEMDESIYKLAVGYVTFENIEEDETLKDPYLLIDELRKAFSQLMNITTDRESRMWLQSLLRNIDTLEDRINDIRVNIEAGGQYDENMEMLDNNIYILTELIQDDIQYYIYYQTRSMETLKVQLNSEIESFIFLCIFLVGAITAIVLLATMVVLNNITNPLRKLCEVTKRISEGDFTAQTQIETNDEIRILAQSVDDMAGKLEVMVDKIKEDESKMRYAELRLLQEQINPHFLYNTLDTIVWLVEGNETDKAVDVVVSLSEFFRLVLSKGKEFISIQDEEMHIRSYLEIQRARYHDILDYEILIDRQLYQYKILKMTLQPLVENSLYHGIKYKRAKGKIVVTAELKDNKICIYVCDNGVGMEVETLEKLRKEIQSPCKETESGFGLANVNERIRMNFGVEYGIFIDSVKGEGTRVTVIIPAQKLHMQQEITEEAERVDDIVEMAAEGGIGNEA